MSAGHGCPTAHRRCRRRPICSPSAHSWISRLTLAVAVRSRALASSSRGSSPSNRIRVLGKALPQRLENGPNAVRGEFRRTVGCKIIGADQQYGDVWWWAGEIAVLQPP